MLLKEKNKTENVHSRVFQTFKELQQKLPMNFLKMKVISSQKYIVPKLTVLNEIEKKKLLFKNHGKSIKPVENKKSIFIFTEEKSKKRFENQMKTLMTQRNNSIENLKKKYLSLNYDEESSCSKREFNDSPYNEKIKLQRNYPYPHYTKDSDMKTNVYLPSIISRLKCSVPRSQRETNGFLIQGQSIELRKGEIFHKCNSIKNNNNLFTIQATPSKNRYPQIESLLSTSNDNNIKSMRTLNKNKKIIIRKELKIDSDEDSKN